MASGTDGYRAVATLYNALMTGLVLSLVTRKGEAVARAFVKAHFRRQHLEKFLPGLTKLGLADEPDAVACALYHFFSNALGGVKTEYYRESDRKAWVRYPPPRWIWRGTAACGIPHSVNTAMLDGWHGHNGVSLANPRLGFVCTATLTSGQPGLEGYYYEHDHALAPQERVRFVTDEHMPRVDIAAQPALDTASWPAERLARVHRSYALEYFRSLAPTLVELIGVEEACAEIARTARLIGMQFFEELALPEVSAGDTSSAGRYARWLGAMLLSHGESVSVADNGLTASVTMQGWRLMQGVKMSPETLPDVRAAWQELWIGAALAHDRFLQVRLDTSVADTCVWHLAGAD